MRFLLASVFAYSSSVCSADTIVPTRTLRAHTIITSSDLLIRPVDTPGTFASVDALLGQEARVTLYAGRPIRNGDVGPPAVVERNQIVTLQFAVGGLEILVDGRSLGRGGPGDRIRVMNLNSRTTLFGTIKSNGTVLIGESNR